MPTVWKQVAEAPDKGMVSMLTKEYGIDHIAVLSAHAKYWQVNYTLPPCGWPNDSPAVASS